MEFQGWESEAEDHTDAEQGDDCLHKSQSESQCNSLRHSKEGERHVSLKCDMTHSHKSYRDSDRDSENDSWGQQEEETEEEEEEEKKREQSLKGIMCRDAAQEEEFGESAGERGSARERESAHTFARGGVVARETGAGVFASGSESEGENEAVDVERVSVRERERERERERDVQSDTAVEVARDQAGVKGWIMCQVQIQNHPVSSPPNLLLHASNGDF